MKSVQIPNFFDTYFSVSGLNTNIYEVDLLFSPNTGKYGPEKTPYLDTFHAVVISNTATFAEDTTQYSTYARASDFS